MLGATVLNISMIKSRWTVVIVLLFSILVLPVPVAAEVLPPEEGRYTGPCLGEDTLESTWFDRSHSYITSMLCQPSIWFDGFFGQHQAGADWAGSLVRWEGSYRLDEQEKPVFRSEFDASVRLPKLSKKVRLIVTSKNRDDQTISHPDDDPFNPEVPPELGTTQESQTTAGLRFYLIDTKKARLHVGAGIKLGNPVQPYVRLRLRYTEPLGSSSLVRFTPSIIWLQEDGINRSVRVDLERRMSKNVLARASQSFVREELEDGVRWGTVLTLYDRLATVTVLAIEAAATGTTHPQNMVERYRLAARLRSNFLKDWLFLEVEPEYYWPRDEQGEYHLFRAITFRLEMQFYS